MNVYWAKCGKDARNFGDTLTTLICDFLGIPTQWAPPERAELFGVGSILEAVPEKFRGVVWTSGQIRESTRPDLRQAHVLAVRGPRTLERIRCSSPESVVLGDGGLLCDLFYRPAAKRFKLGIVPHYVHSGDPTITAIAAKSSEITIIDVCSPAREVVQRIGQCEAILSSSLHGLIVADSLGIPSEWLGLSTGSGTVVGEGFKFCDHFALFGVEDDGPIAVSPTDRLDTLLPRIRPYTRPGIDDIKTGLLRTLREMPRRHGLTRWRRSSLDIAAREFRALSRLGGDFISYAAAASLRSSGSPDSPLTTVGEARKDLADDASRLAQFFCDCLCLLRQLQERGVTHRAISTESLMVRERRPILADFGWSTIDGDSCFEPHAQSKSAGRDDRDLEAMGRLFDQVNSHRHPAFDPIIQLMTCPDDVLRVRNIEALIVLFQAAAQDLGLRHRLSDGEPDDGGRELLGPTDSVHIDAAVLRKLIANIGVRDQSIAAGCAERSALDAELWHAKRLLVAREIADIVPAGERFIMVDEDQLSIDDMLENRRRIPFPEAAGCYAGPPADDASAICELERLRRSGPSHFAIMWTASWWVMHYEGLLKYVRDQFPCTLENERVMLFDLRRRH